MNNVNVNVNVIKIKYIVNALEKNLSDYQIKKWMDYNNIGRDELLHIFKHYIKNK